MADRLEVASSASAARPANESAASSASAARPAHESGFLNLQERRIAWDGKPYRFEEFATHYGLSRAVGLWQKSECLVRAEQPVGITAGHPVDSAARPVDMTANHPVEGQIDDSLDPDEPERKWECMGCGSTSEDIRAAIQELSLIHI